MPATPAPPVPEAPEPSAGGVERGQEVGEEEEEADAPWRQRHAALAAFLERSEDGQPLLLAQLSRLPVRRRLPRAPPRRSRTRRNRTRRSRTLTARAPPLRSPAASAWRPLVCPSAAAVSCAQAEALVEQAAALEQRALWLSCREADELERAGSVLGGAARSPAPLASASPSEPATGDAPAFVSPPLCRKRRRTRPGAPAAAVSPAAGGLLTPT